MNQAHKPLFERILELDSEAFEARNYETAYHLLMAALHAAAHEPAERDLERLRELSAGHGAAVESVKPTHILAREPAQHRGQTALFDSMEAHIEAVRARRLAEQTRRHAEQARSDHPL
jgi:hypothetical protein